jgi:hypothetical protein
MFENWIRRAGYYHKCLVSLRRLSIISPSQSLRGVIGQWLKRPWPPTLITRALVATCLSIPWIFFEPSVSLHAPCCRRHFYMPGQEQDRGDFKVVGSRRRETQLTTMTVRTKEQDVANALAGLPTSRFTAVNSKDQPTTAMSNGVYGNWKRGPSSANSYHSYTGLKKNDHSYLLVRAHA